MTACSVEIVVDGAVDVVACMPVSAPRAGLMLTALLLVISSAPGYTVAVVPQAWMTARRGLPAYGTVDVRPMTMEIVSCDDAAGDSVAGELPTIDPVAETVRSSDRHSVPAVNSVDCTRRVSPPQAWKPWYRGYLVWLGPPMRLRHRGNHPWPVSESTSMIVNARDRMGLGKMEKSGSPSCIGISLNLGL